jgi:hypothetical protein
MSTSKWLNAGQIKPTATGRGGGGTVKLSKNTCLCYVCVVPCSINLYTSYCTGCCVTYNKGLIYSKNIIPHLCTMESLL